ncbi:MAG: hypothetical protein ACO218_08630 [Steroidobacteraceae bacterium]
MSITVGGLTIRALKGLPFAHSGDSLSGRTARRWPVDCILSPADWLTLDGIYTTWRTARLADQDTMVSLAVGSTVSTSGQIWGLSWSNVPAWFSSPPIPTAAGAMVGVSFELVDATQQLAVMLREQEIGTQVADNDSTYGTLSVGGLTLNLTAEAPGFDGGPSMELAATGTHVIRGPLLATKVRRVQGWTHTAAADDTIRAWFESTIATTPAVGDWFPVSPPQVEQTPVIVNGARVTRFTISLELRQVR